MKTITTNRLEVRSAAGDLKEFVDENGFKAIRWRDEYVTGDWGNATGAAAPAFSNFTIGGVAMRKITLDANDARTNVFEVPHDMLMSAEALLQPEIHVHFKPTTDGTGTVIFFLTPVWSRANTSGDDPVIDPEALPEMARTVTIAVGSAEYPSYVATFGHLPIRTYTLGDLIDFKIERRTGEGTYTADVIMDKVALHVPVDDRGSREMYTK